MKQSYLFNDQTETWLSTAVAAIGVMMCGWMQPPFTWIFVAAFAVCAVFVVLPFVRRVIPPRGTPFSKFFNAFSFYFYFAITIVWCVASMGKESPDQWMVTSMAVGKWVFLAFAIAGPLLYYLPLRHRQPA